MADSFELVRRRVMAQCPLAPALLAEMWVQDGYNLIADQRPWSWLRGENNFTINVSKSGTVNVTKGSSTVTGVGLTFAATDADRQFRVGGTGVPYSISTVNVGLNTAVLDQSYAGETAAATTASIFDGYVTCPEDFGRFIAVLDLTNAYNLHLWVTESELNLWDPNRVNSGTPFSLVSRRLASTSALNGRIQYELWPYALTTRTYKYFYVKRPASLVDADTFLGPLRHRTDILLKAALVAASEWPGTLKDKNPYFNLGLAQYHRDQLMKELDLLAARDEEVYMTWMDTVGINRNFAPIDSKYMQNHDMGFVNNAPRY